MSKYINEDELLKAIAFECDHDVQSCNDCRNKCDLYSIIINQKDIIRCKDCKWWDKEENSLYGYCLACKHGYSSSNWEIRIYRTYKGDWFCAEGALKEKEEEEYFE